MSGELTTLFEGKEIRVIEKDGEAWIPCRDLSLALGLDRYTLYQHVKRNRDFFGDDAKDGDNLSPDDSDLWVNEGGLYTLLARVSIGRVTPIAKAAIIQFRKSVPVLIQRYRKKEIVQIPPAPDIKAELVEARGLAEACQRSPETFQAAILRKHGKGELADVLQVPAIVHGDSGWFNITQLVAMCNDPLLNPERLNWYLANNPKDPERRPYQYRDPNRLWRLTSLGREHGKEYMFTAYTQHSEVRIAWRESILYASGLKRQIANDQAALAAPAHG